MAFVGTFKGYSCLPLPEIYNKKDDINSERRFPVFSNLELYIHFATGANIHHKIDS